MFKKLLFFLAILFGSSYSYAQRFNPDTVLTVVIDSTVNIKSHKLTAQDFIDAVVADTGFYKAFRNMKRYAFVADNHIYTYDKKK